MGKICVHQRNNACLNENALFRSPLTMDQYLNARPIADPLRLYDCVMACSGANAIVIGATDRVKKGKSVRVLSGFERHNHLPDQIVPLEGGWQTYKDKLWDTAGYGPHDMNLVNVYDDYPIIVAIQLEDLGFCSKGDVGQFLAANNLAYNGSFPINTGGGQLSVGQAGMAGGLMLVTEAVCQLRQEAGSRQVSNAKRAIASGYGMVGYGHGLSTSAAVLEIK